MAIPEKYNTDFTEVLSGRLKMILKINSIKEYEKMPRTKHNRARLSK